MVRRMLSMAQAFRAAIQKNHQKHQEVLPPNSFLLPRSIKTQYVQSCESLSQVFELMIEPKNLIFSYHFSANHIVKYGFE